MVKSLIEKWADALESGKYKQTIGSLHDVNGYCCLGVLQKITKNSLARHIDCELLDSDDFSNKFELRNTKEIVENRIVLTEQEETNCGDTIWVQSYLSILNDGNVKSEKKNFKQIARWIRKNLKDA